MGFFDRSVLANNDQNNGQVSDITKLEAIHTAIADEHDKSWTDYNTLKTNLASTTAGASGAHSVASASIAGVAGANVYEQIVDIKSQINQSAAGLIPDGSIPETKLAFAIATQAELDAALLESRNNSASSKIYAYRNMGGL